MENAITTCHSDCACTHEHAVHHHHHEKEITTPQKDEFATKPQVFELRGLDCIDCAGKLEIKINNLPGVTQARVNFGASKLYVEGNIKADKIIKGVREAGYEVWLPENLGDKNKPFLLQNKKTLFTLISGILWLMGGAIWFSGFKELAIAVLLPAILVGGFYTVKSAYYSIKTSFVLDMNVLMTIAVTGALFLGEWLEAATVVFLFALGNTLEAYTMDKTRKSIKGLMELAPQEALVMRDGIEVLMSVAEIKLGERVIIKPGARIPVDGKVVEGRSAVNQAPITGESIPVAKTMGDGVFAGTINENGLLIVETNRLAGDTTLDHIVTMVEEAQDQKAPAERFVDTFAKYYTPTVIMLAVLIAALPPLLMGEAFSPWFYKAITLLVVACPCALVISTPVSIVAALGNAANKGVLIKGGAYLEGAGKLKGIAFDKTGTLTMGNPIVTDLLPAKGYTAEGLLQIAAGVEKGSEHPLAGAILNGLQERKLEHLTATGFSALPGQGVKALIKGETYYVGSPGFFAEELKLINNETEKQIEQLEEEGKTVVAVGTQKELMGIIACGDTLRESSLKAIKTLNEKNLATLMLTGDNSRAAESLAKKLQLTDFKASLLPEDKVTAIKEFKEQYDLVAMVGDGINDAPALAAADIGIAMGGAGTDTALETADIVLMADDLSQLPFLLDLSRKALNIIRQNIGFALLVKIAAVLLVFPGILNLWIAILADTGATLVVIANGMRLLRVKN